MKIGWLLFLAGALVPLSGCTMLKMNAVKERAAFDFSCDQDAITVQNIGGDSFGAEGCGQKGSYVCLRDGWGEITCVMDAHHTSRPQMEPLDGPEDD